MRELNDIPQWEWTEVELRRAIKATRQEEGGISLKRIAEIIAKELEYDDLVALGNRIYKICIKEARKKSIIKRSVR